MRLDFLERFGRRSALPVTSHMMAARSGARVRVPQEGPKLRTPKLALLG
jgi:hypothetical protein